MMRRWGAWMMAASLLLSGCSPSGSSAVSAVKDPPAPSEVVSVSTTTATAVPPERREAYMVDVDLLCQWPWYPTGCEAVSAVMVLNYAGLPISVEAFIDSYLPCDFNFYLDGDEYHGPDPYAVFVGDPSSEESFGCMASVIESACRLALKSVTRVVNTTGASMETLCRDYIDRDQPVIVWATIGMEETDSLCAWTLENGDVFYWPANEHCMVLVGYDETYYYVNDPYTGERERYTKAIFEARYEALGSQSLVILSE